MDKETKQVISEAERIKYTIDTEGWKIMSRILEDLLEANDSISNLDTIKPEEVLNEIKSRRLAGSIIKDWIDQIQGRVQNASSFKNIKDEENDYLDISAEG